MSGKITHFVFKRPYFLNKDGLLNKPGYFIYKSSWGTLDKNIPLVDICEKEEDVFEKYENVKMYEQNIIPNISLLKEAHSKIKELKKKDLSIEEILISLKKDLNLEDLELEILEKIYLEEI